MQAIVLLSGPIAVGKTAVADVLAERFHFKKISSGSYLAGIAAERRLPVTRTTLQELGDHLDQQTNHAWIVDDVAAVQMESEPEQLDWFIDAVRKPKQIANFRLRFPNVLHVHLIASDQLLRTRFSTRARSEDETESPRAYERSVAHPNEQTARSLGAIADLVIDLGTVSSMEAAELINQWTRVSAKCTE